MIVVVVTFLDESSCLPVLLGSMAAQTRLPDRLVLVDDGSSDGSERIAADFATEHDYATVLTRPARRPAADRLAQANELQAFRWAVDQLEPVWGVVAKMDADLDLAPATLDTIERAFLSDARLGMAGARLSERADDGALVPMASPEDHVEGATKFYRRACWEDISPIPAILGWDTLDEFHARLLGWRTRSFSVPGRDPIHLRRMGTHGAILASFRRWGACSYGYGAHPLHVAFYALRLMRRRPPRVIGGVNYLVGWALAATRRAPRAAPELRRAVRREQIARARRRLRARTGA